MKLYLRKDDTRQNTTDRRINLLKTKTYFMYRQFDIQQFYVLPTQLYLCVLCGSQNKQPLFPYTALNDFFFNLSI